MKKSTSRKKRSSKFFIKHPLFVPVSSFVVLFFVGLVLLVTLGASTKGPTDARIVNIYLDNEQRTVTTRAQTVGELLERTGIELNEKDLVEPKIDTTILEDNTQINIYRSRPVQIIDQGRTITVVTAQRAPRLIAADANVAIEVEDELSLQKPTGTVLESSASEQVVIERSVPVQLNVYGVIKPIRTTDKTVGEVLAAQGIAVREGDVLTPASETVITAGMFISVNVIGVKTEAVSEPIPFSTETVDDDTIEVGKSTVEQAGVDGERAVVYEITEQDGVEVSRKELSVVVIREPVVEKRRRGTKVTTPYFDPTTSVSADKVALMSAAGISASDYAYVDYIVSKESGWRPGALNRSSGAYGLCQSLPASKMASAGADYLTNPVTQLRWCSGYSSRYGGWAGAYAAWQVQNWW